MGRLASARLADIRQWITPVYRNELSRGERFRDRLLGSYLCRVTNHEEGRTGEDWPAVAAAITARMRERRVSQQALAAASGVSVATLRVLQHGMNGRRAQDTTLVAVARALGWRDDHLLRVLLGTAPGEPVAVQVPADERILAVLLRMERQLGEIRAQLTDARRP